MNADIKHKETLSAAEIKKQEDDHLHAKSNAKNIDEEEAELNDEATEKANAEKDLSKI